MLLGRGNANPGKNLFPRVTAQVRRVFSGTFLELINWDEDADEF
jgi:hypothetical protein